MLNKDVCKKCWSDSWPATGASWLGSDNSLWIDNKVACPGYRYPTPFEKAFETCPRQLEHMIANGVENSKQGCAK